MKKMLQKIHTACSRLMYKKTVTVKEGMAEKKICEKYWLTKDMVAKWL